MGYYIHREGKDMWRKMVATFLFVLIAGVAPGIGGPATGTPVEGRIAECVAGSDIDDTLIQDLRSQGWGYGEIAMMFYLAQESAKSTSRQNINVQSSVKKILEMRSQGMGWGQIAQELGLHPSTLGKAQRALRSCEQKVKKAGVTSGQSKQKANAPKGNQGPPKKKGR